MIHCAYERLEDGRLRCPVCGDTTTRKWAEVPKKICTQPVGPTIKRNLKSAEPPLPEPIDGPGTQFKALLAEMKVIEKPACSCERLRKDMNRLGVVGCKEPHNRDRILKAMQANRDKFGLTEQAMAGLIAFWSRLPLSLEGLYGEAVRRAENLESYQSAASNSQPQV